MRATAFVLGCIAALVWCCSPTATANQQTTADISNTTCCDVYAYVIDHDPQGLNVRSGAGKNFTVIGNLPLREETGISVHITGSNGDWFRIDSANEEGSDEEQTFFKGDGWVYGPLLGLSGIGGGTRLYQQASVKSRIIARVPGDEGVTLRGCRGKWFYVEFNKIKGWAAPQTLCDNPLTTCP